MSRIYFSDDLMLQTQRKYNVGKDFKFDIVKSKNQVELKVNYQLEDMGFCYPEEDRIVFSKNYCENVEIFKHQSCSFLIFGTTVETETKNERGDAGVIIY